MRRAFPIALAAGCGGATPSVVENTGGDTVALAADASLRGPIDRLEDLPPEVRGDPDSPVEITVLGSAPGDVTVALREVRVTATGATCLVTLETRDGFFFGDGFLCAADRSDETVVTDSVSVTIDGRDATILFRTSYQLDRNTPEITAGVIRCSLGTPLSCTPPPPIGGYE